MLGSFLDSLYDARRLRLCIINVKSPPPRSS
jgi:hypothetical protein